MANQYTREVHDILRPIGNRTVAKFPTHDKALADATARNEVTIKETGHIRYVVGYVEADWTRF